MINFFILFGMREKMPLFEVWVLPVLAIKSRHLEFSPVTDFEYWETSLIFGKPLVCHCVKYDSLFHSVWHERKMTFFEL